MRGNAPAWMGLVLTSSAAIAAPVTIDFEGQTAGAAVPGVFSQDGANFSVDSFAAWGDSDLLGETFNNISGIVYGNMVGTVDVVTVTFDTPIHMFEFGFFLDDGVGGITFPDETADVLDVRVFDTNGQFDTVDAGAFRNDPNPYPEGLAAYSTLQDIVKIEIDMNSPPGLTFWNIDNFTFDTAVVIPLPHSAGLALAGMGALAVRRRRTV